MSTQPQYEFSQDQNALIGDLAGKMSFVGLFFNVLGVLNILAALIVILAIYKDRVPKEWIEKLPDDVKVHAKEIPYDKLPANNHLWGISLNAATVGLFYLLMGTWTRSAAGSFQQIVATQGNDISHLMNALGSLRSMYGLVYTLLMITLLICLIAIGLALYARFAM